jgi:hypothetical protein
MLAWQLDLAAWQALTEWEEEQKEESNSEF